jgi:hypothetical protein
MNQPTNQLNQQIKLNPTKLKNDKTRCNDPYSSYNPLIRAHSYIYPSRITHLSISEIHPFIFSIHPSLSSPFIHFISSIHLFPFPFPLPFLLSFPLPFSSSLPSFPPFLNDNWEMKLNKGKFGYKY